MLHIENVYKSFKNKKVLNGISFSIDSGSIVSLLGSNGSGKTTTFRIILGLIRPDSGCVSYNNRELNNQDIGFLPEERSMYFDCTVFQQLRFITRLNNISDEDATERIENYLSRFKMNEYADVQLGKLSKGNQQKIALIMAIIKNPKIVILDEPFTGLDANNIDIFKNEIQNLKNNNKIIIVSSHIYQPINEICDRYIYLKNGLVNIDLTKEEIKRNSQKVLLIENVDFDFDNEGIESETIENNRIKYIIKNATCANRIMKIVQNNNLEYEYRSLRIEDLIK